MKLPKSVRQFFISDFLINILLRARLKKKFITAKIDEEIKNSDFVILGGGNAVFDLSPYSKSVYNIELIMDAAKKHNKLVFVTSIGMGPFKKEKQVEASVKVISQADYITVRDKKTKSYFDKYLVENVFQSIDPVFRYPLLNFNKLKNSVITEIGINVMDLRFNKNSDVEVSNYHNSIVKLVNELSKNKRYNITLFVSEPRDKNALLEIYDAVKMLDNVRKEEIIIPKDLFNLYEKLDLIIGTRMHSMIIGLVCGIPVIGISWQQKVLEMFRYIDLEGFCFDLKTFLKNPSLISKKVENIKYTDLKQDINLKISKIKEDFTINEEIVNLIKTEIIRDNNE